MPDGGYDPHAPFRRTQIRQAIGKWRDSLINLTGSNRLLNFKPSKTGMVAVARPAPGEVLARIGLGKSFSFRPLRPRVAEAGTEEEAAAQVTVPPSSADCLDIDKDPVELVAALRSLQRRSTQAYLDQGLSILYLAFGTLVWLDEDRTRYASPLLLVPVQLVAAGNKQLPVVGPTEDDTVVNPALALKLDRYGIQLPRVDDLDEISLDGLLDAVRVAVAGRDGWQVRESLALSCFSFAKEAMYRDLLTNEDRIAAHDAVAALACGGGAAGGPTFTFEEIPEREIDLRAPPESTPVILDADSSQRACIAAALAGRSFVMDGPPGTGKSQTIANMIGVLLHAGKTVLFVSEKAAALDVVRDRLDAAGLRTYLLELHSHKATRKQVAVELGKALDTRLVPPASMSAIDVDSARKRREQLNAYADAMNQVRKPLGYSVHAVLGMLAGLHAVPAAPMTGLAPVDLTVEAFGEIRRTAAVLAAAWRPAMEGQSFIWRGVTEEGSLDWLLYQAAAALATLDGIAKVNTPLAAATGLTRPSDASALAGLLQHLAARSAGLPENWLTATALDAVTDAVARLADCLDEISTREERTAQAAGVPWRTVPGSDTLPAPADTRPPGTLVPPAVDPGDLQADQIAALLGRFTAVADMLENRLAGLAGLAGLLGLRAPVTFAEADDLLAFTRLAEVPELPERSWLTRDGLAAATDAAAALRSAQHTLAKTETNASAYYTPTALGEDVDGLEHRFTTQHHGLGKLSGEYRADKKTVAGFTREGISKDAAHQHLGLAVAWKHATEALGDTEHTNARRLGAYYTGRLTDFEQLDRALRVAETAIRRSRGQDLSRAADHIARDSLPIAPATSIAHDTAEDLNAWRSAPAPCPQELLGGSIRDAIDWLRPHLAPLETATAFTRAVSDAIGRPLTADQARHIMVLRREADTAHERLTEHSAEFSDTFGELYIGPETDIRDIRLALEWARSLRSSVNGADVPLIPAQIKAIDTAVPTGNLPAAAESWNQARNALLEAFDADRRQDLAAELDEYEDGADLIEALRQDTGGQDEWHSYQRARKALARYRISAAIDFCISDRLPSEQVPQVIERALLQEWAEHQLKTDPAFRFVRATDRNALVAEYQKLDRALITAATGNIIRACNARRPRTDIGESAVIRREAEKKKKHMPVRTLIDRSRNVTQAIKPCFMMSPLSVSQFLPADMHFDVVIFDEASQVSPGDAINCIYRGSALILAGDQKQLPPTNFFTSALVDEGDEWSEDADDVTDFESVLDLAKAAGVYRNLTLRWHYRSRHEALIAFSNASFYEGRLVTFPSVHSDGPDVGVELFPVTGTYRRGSSRDNPDEAVKVAERVIHHCDTRPTWSLGVVTFSEAQALAIETAVRRARQGRPDLDRFFDTDDRLRGFFVKSLESVQGDERDVLIFSVGYGPDENRKITMHFGPLNKQGGWRRLNVAITRAHYRNEIVSSIQASDIPETANAEGVRQLRRYLDYAARGMPALALDTSTGGDAESPFEESVISVIRSWGYEVTPQVGTAGYRIDIGIRHPGHPGAFALGVECDGYYYHSSRVARDRDRLREEVLRGLGWRLHRIWGTAWYRDRHGEEYKLRIAIENALAAPVRGLLAEAGLPPVHDRLAVETVPATFDQIPAWATPYVTAAVPRLPSWVDPSEPGSHYHMIPAIRAIVAAEGPVHMAVLQERLRDAWNIGRIGSRIRANIDAAIRDANVLRDGDFLTPSDAMSTKVRTPTQSCRRDIAEVHDDELAFALIRLVDDAGGVSQDDLATRVARLYGWTRRGPDITARMQALITDLRASGALSGGDDNLTISNSRTQVASPAESGGGVAAVASLPAEPTAPAWAGSSEDGEEATRSAASLSSVSASSLADGHGLRTRESALEEPGSARRVESSIERVPRTEAEQQQLLRERPYPWEYFYFAARLLYERSLAEPKYRGYLRGYAVRGDVIIVSYQDFAAYVDRAMRDAQRLVGEDMSRVWNRDAQEHAFGALGEDGDAEAIERLAKSMNSIYVGLMDWTAKVRGVSRPSKFDRYFELLSSINDSSISAYRKFVDDLVAYDDELPARIATGEPSVFEMNIRFTIPEETKKALTDEFARLNRIQLWLVSRELEDG